MTRPVVSRLRAVTARSYLIPVMGTFLFVVAPIFRKTRLQAGYVGQCLQEGRGEVNFLIFDMVGDLAVVSLVLLVVGAMGMGTSTSVQWATRATDIEAEAGLPR
jgi:hypothetical protein